MTRVQFLNDLYRRLGTMSREEAEQHLTYYAEMLADRMEEGMTEEEAVASMEDVDTIARRILQESGNPVAKEEPQVHADHDASPAAAERKTSRRRWIVIAVVVLVFLIILPIAAIVGWISFNFMGPTTTTQHGIQIDTVDGSVSIDKDGLWIEDDGEIVGIGPGGITVDTENSITNITPNGVSGSEKVDPSYTASDREPYLVPTRGIRSIQVEWVAGDVRIQPWEGEDIRLTELFAENTKPEKGDYLDYVIDEGELEVRFSRTGRGTGRKMLILEIPAALADGALGDCEVETSSADVLISDVSFASVNVETGSGSAVLEEVGSRIDVDTGSGDVTVRGGEALKSLEADTGSGDVTLHLARETAPNLRFRTGSGKLDNAGGFALTGSGLRLDVETGSGDLHLLEKE